MKKDELIAAVQEIRVQLRSEQIVKGFTQAFTAGVNTDQKAFSENVMRFLVEGIGNFPRMTETARVICNSLDIASYYRVETNSEILHHIAAAKGTNPTSPQQAGSQYRDNYLVKPSTLFFVEAHKRVVMLSNLLDVTLRAERPEGVLLLEGITAEGGPTLDRVSETLATVYELIGIYCESQGESEKPRIEVNYLDLGSNFQIGVKVDTKAEIGVNLTRFLTELFRWVVNPRAYSRERRAEGMSKEITIFADLQKRVDAGELTVEAANLFAERMLGCGTKLASQNVFPAALIREQTVTSPAVELMSIMNEGAKPHALLPPSFLPITK